MLQYLERPEIIVLIVIIFVILIVFIYLFRQLSSNQSSIDELKEVNAANIKEFGDLRKHKESVPGIVNSMREIADHTNALINSNNIIVKTNKSLQSQIKAITKALKEKDIVVQLPKEKDKKKKGKSKKRDDSSDEDDDSSSSEEEEEPSDTEVEDILRALNDKKKGKGKKGKGK